MKMRTGRTVLDDILDRSELKLAADKSRCPLADQKKRVQDAPPVVSFYKALKQSFGLIAEIKRRSPSLGEMLYQDVAEIARQYQASDVVRAISVLTNRDDFGMSIEDLAQVRALTKKPILRKDFVFDEYQVYEARANGADAVLLMAGVLTDQAQLTGLFELSKGLGMDVLYECRSKEEIDRAPDGVTIYGINSRKMHAKKVFGVSRYTIARIKRFFGMNDQSVQLNKLNLVSELPPQSIKVAESGIDPDQIARVRHILHYDAALIGTAILTAPQGVQWSLNQFATALKASKRLTPGARQSPRPAVAA
jgi:indole-3-glycerol phosphate synthase